MTYRRVIPRDLFNEADLLKCLGRLWIKLDETSDHSATLEGPAFPDERFYIEQDGSDGSIEVVNVTFRLSEYVSPRLFRPLNSREKWSLWMRRDDDDVRVFDLDGELSPEFWVAISQPEMVARRRERL